MRVVLLAAKDHLDLLAQMESQETEDSTEYLYVPNPLPHMHHHHHHCSVYIGFRW